MIRVLYIEDDRVDSEWVARALAQDREKRFLLECVDTLSKGLERLREGKFDLVLLDLQLPDGFGLEIFESVDQIAPHLPKVLFTGSIAEEKLAVQALQLGAQDYIVKGEMDERTLIRSLRYAVERKQAQEKLRETYKQLKEKAEELECLNKLMTGREERILELKQQVADLEKELSLLRSAKVSSDD